MNQTDPLAELRDIHLPDPISAWPPGPGWWVLGSLLLASLLLLAWWLRRRYRANAWKRQASGELADNYTRWRESGDDCAYLQACSEILKRAALQQFSAAEVASLNGAHWEQFLDRQWRREPASGFRDSGFAQQAYRAAPEPVDIDALHDLGLQWLRQARSKPC